MAQKRSSSVTDTAQGTAQIYKTLANNNNQTYPKDQFNSIIPPTRH